MRTPLISVAAALAIFELMLIWLVWTGRVETFDFPLRQTILAFDPLGAVAIWRGITFLGSSIFIAALAVIYILIFAVRSEWQAVKHLAVVMIGAVVIDTGLKWIVHRARPDEVFAQTMPTSYSFPSGHALFAIVLYIGIVTILAQRLGGIARTLLWVFAIIVVLLIGLSRIFLGVHYPTDVLGGYVGGALWLIVVDLFMPPNRLATQ